MILLIQIIEQSYINENTFVLFLVSSILTIFTLFSISITIGSIYALISSVIGAIFLFANTNIIFTLLLLMQLTAILYTYTVIPYSTQSNIELSIQATLLKSIPVFYIIQTDISVDTIILLCTSLQSFVMLNTDNPNIAVLWNSICTTFTMCNTEILDVELFILMYFLIVILFLNSQLTFILQFLYVLFFIGIPINIITTSKLIVIIFVLNVDIDFILNLTIYHIIIVVVSELTSTSFTGQCGMFSILNLKPLFKILYINK